MRIRGLRAWCTARGRGQFALTLTTVVMLTCACGALVVLPNFALPEIRAAQPASALSLGQVAADDPRLATVRRILEPFGEISTERIATGDGQESLVVGHENGQAEMTVLGDELPRAVAAVTELWGPQWPRSAMIVVAGNASEFAALVRAGSLLPGEVAAVTVTDPFAPGAMPTGQRVVFSPDAGARLTPDQLRTLLRHELTHVATRAVTVDGAARWMLEGFAEYAAHRAQGHRFGDIAPTVAARIRAGELPTGLPSDADFSGSRATETYESAWSACAFVAEKYGQTDLVDLYRRIAAGPADSAAQDRMLREVLGTDTAEFVARWREWLSAQPR
ncbi:hypothetical protein OG225_03465 [Nocardia sp. NBC_01377]|uniref:hypothetical protein n=1 Tax=Nocardia sp. NBC_01377 TaxID=2903595 RepID=UPI003243F456